MLVSTEPTAVAPHALSWQTIAAFNADGKTIAPPPQSQPRTKLQHRHPRVLSVPQLSG
jgi:hypothetical protein